jgi:hypothetical protein
MSLTKVSYSMITGAPANVLDFGAVGNGTTDDTAAIQAAITAVSAAGGGVITLPGIFKISATINLADNVVLRGFGYATGIYWSAVSAVAALNASGKSNFGIENMRIYGNSTAAANGSYLVAITDASHNAWVSGCFIDTCYIGIFVGNVSTSSSYAVNIFNNTINNIGLNGIGVNCFGTDIAIYDNLIYNCGIIASGANVGGGIEYRGATQGRISDNIIRDCQYSTAGTCDGIRIEYATEGATQQVSYVSVNGNVISNVSGFGIRGQYILNCSITGNTLIGAATCSDGITLLGDNTTGKSSNNNSITGNSIVGWASNASVNISGASATFCVGNVVSGNSMKTGNNGVSITNGNDNLVTGNNLQGFSGLGLVQYSGTGNAIIGNVIANGTASGLLISGGTKTVVTGNDVRANSSAGIIVNSGATYTVINSNTSRDNGTNQYQISDATTVQLTMDTNGVAFFGLATPSAKQTITGSKGANAALTSLLTALSGYGLITDSST